MNRPRREKTEGKWLPRTAAATERGCLEKKKGKNRMLYKGFKDMPDEVLLVFLKAWEAKVKAALTRKGKKL